MQPIYHSELSWMRTKHRDRIPHLPPFVMDAIMFAAQLILVGSAIFTIMALIAVLN